MAMLPELPPHVKDLSGVWQFAFVPGAQLEELSLDKLSFTSYAPVPGCFDLLPDQWMRRGTGVYRTTVEAGGPVELGCDGLGLRGDFFWDGKKIGSCCIPFSSTRLSFDAGEKGSHELAIAVCNIIDNTPSSPFKGNYDFYAHGGIYRKVTIAPQTAFAVKFLKVLPLVPEEGKVQISLCFRGDTAQLEKGTLLFDTSAEPIPFQISNGEACCEVQVPSPKVWSPESPELHTVTVTVNGLSFTASFGLRTVAVKEGKLLLNGKELKIAGVNRHDCHPDFGYAIPYALQLKDLLMLKEKGFNCIRGCHYPQSEEFLTLCDKMGMLVWEESLAWGNKEADLADPVFCEHQLQQAEELVYKSINHPSVIMWGFLNECASETAAGRTLIENLVTLFRSLDPTRPITFGSNRVKNDICLDLVDIISFNVYPCWYLGNDEQFMDTPFLTSYLQELSDFASAPEYRSKALIISEVGAEGIPGDHSGMRWSEEYQAELLGTTMRHVLESDRYTGTFLWQFCDTRTYISNASQVRTGGFNHKGMVDGSRNVKLSFKEVGRIIKDYFSKQD